MHTFSSTAVLVYIEEGEGKNGDFRGKMVQLEKVKYESRSSSRSLKEHGKSSITELLRYLRFPTITAYCDSEKNYP